MRAEAHVAALLRRPQSVWALAALVGILIALSLVTRIRSPGENKLSSIALFFQRQWPLCLSGTLFKTGVDFPRRCFLIDVLLANAGERVCKTAYFCISNSLHMCPRHHICCLCVFFSNHKRCVLLDRNLGVRDASLDAGQWCLRCAAYEGRDRCAIVVRLSARCGVRTSLSKGCVFTPRLYFVTCAQ